MHQPLVFKGPFEVDVIVLTKQQQMPEQIGNLVGKILFERAARFAVRPPAPRDFHIGLRHLTHLLLQLQQKPVRIAHEIIRFSIARRDRLTAGLQGFEVKGIHGRRLDQDHMFVKCSLWFGCECATMRCQLVTISEMEMSEPRTKTNTDRAKSQLTEDLFDRDTFVRRVVDLLIDQEAHRSTGVVIGIEGPWGSGKSSILNFVTSEISDQYESYDCTKSPIIVHFNPWLITSKESLLLNFFAEFLFGVQQSTAFHIPYNWPIHRVVDEIRDNIGIYANLLEIALDSVLPSLSKVATVFRNLKKRADKGNYKKANEISLFYAKRSLQESISKLNVPILIVIDEVDRISSEEVQLIVQLVKSVADFESVSYLLAYDKHKVATALTHGSNISSLDDGFLFLEKIVQLELKVPELVDGELAEHLKRMLKSEFPGNERIEYWVESEELWDRLGVLLPEPIENSRDIVRIVNLFCARYPVLVDEVDPGDILLWGVIEQKAPRVAQYISKNWHLFTDLYQYSEVSVARHQERLYVSDSALGLLAGDLGSENELPEWTKKLIFSLFPGCKGASESRSDRDKKSPISICEVRSFFALSRMTNPPGAMSIIKVRELISNQEALGVEVIELWSKGRLFELLNRLPELSASKDLDVTGAWTTIIIALENNSEVTRQADNFERTVRDVQGVLLTATSQLRNPGLAGYNILNNLVSSKHLSVAGHVMREQILYHGSFDSDAQRTDRIEVINFDQTISLARDLSQTLSELIQTGDGWSSIPDLSIVFFLRDANEWHKFCFDFLDAFLTAEDVTDRFVLQTNGPGVAFPLQAANEFFDSSRYEERIRHRLEYLEADKKDASLISAYSRALSGGL